MVHGTCGAYCTLVPGRWWSYQWMRAAQNGEDARTDDGHRRFIMDLLLPARNLLSNARYFIALAVFMRYNTLSRATSLIAYLKFLWSAGEVWKISVRSVCSGISKKRRTYRCIDNICTDDLFRVKINGSWRNKYLKIGNFQSLSSS